MPSVPPGTKPAVNAALQQQNATTQAATAAVAAAMAKLGPTTGQQQPQPSKAPPAPPGDVVDNLTKKVNEMRVDQASKTHNHSNNTGGYRARGRGRGRGGPRGIEVPNSDFDFESANAQFKKDELVKEANPEQNGVNGESAMDGTSNEVVIPSPSADKHYDSKSSFFDNISSEAREREESHVGSAAESNRGARGREFRNEDRKRNLETFGIGSVDGGFRGRGRGRGRGFRGSTFRGRARGRGAVMGTG